MTNRRELFTAFAVTLLLLNSPLFAQPPAAWENYPQPGGFIMAMAQDSQGNVWVGTEDKGVYRFDTKKNEWMAFTTKDGLGDDNGYAIACDRLGRVWVGQVNHGVAVYNGESWKTFDVLEGPIGERVFDLAVSPLDGDVWMATSAGLTRYSEKKDTWSHYTRAEGLPEDQASALAFDKNGHLYVGLQTAGISVGKAPDFKSFVTIPGPGPDQLPTTPNGRGLPSGLINDLLVSQDGSIHAATCAGLATSKDGGRNWSYVRGRDYADKVKKRWGGAPKDWQEPTDQVKAALVPEDYITCLAEDESGTLWMGFRQEGCLAWTPRGNLRRQFSKDTAALPENYVSAILPSADSRPWIGGYMGGLHRFAQPLAGGAPRRPVAPVANAAAAKLPSPAAAPTAEELQKAGQEFEKRLAKLPKTAKAPAASKPASGATGNSLPVLIALADDWKTRGDFYGASKYRNYRYGECYTHLCAHSSPTDAVWGRASVGFASVGRTGANAPPDEALRHWVHWLRSNDVRVLKDPHLNNRRQAEWDDHGEAYPMTHEGPHLFVNVKVPLNAGRMAMYFFNKDGHEGNNRFRDYVISIKPYCATDAQFAAAPLLARVRVRDFWGGVYKTFAVSGPGSFTVQIHDNWSFNTIVSGFLFDPLLYAPPRKGNDADIARLYHSIGPDEFAQLPIVKPEEGLPVDPAAEALAYLARLEQLRARAPLAFATVARRDSLPLLRVFSKPPADSLTPKDLRLYLRARGQSAHEARLFHERDAIYATIPAPEPEPEPVITFGNK